MASGMHVDPLQEQQHVWAAAKAELQSTTLANIEAAEKRTLQHCESYVAAAMQQRQQQVRAYPARPCARPTLECFKRS